MGLDYKKTFIIGLGIFTTGMTWNLFNSYVPIFLSYFGISFTLIGLIMTIDNFAAITIQPHFGAKSDKTWSKKFGRRMPYVIIGIPLAAFFFTLIPLFLPKNLINIGNYPIIVSSDVISFGFLTVWIICFDIAMAIYRAPVTALMPDFVENESRSRANGIIQLMGGIGAVFAYSVGAVLYKIGAILPFFVTSIIMIIALFILVKKIKEPIIPAGTFNNEDKINIIQGFKEVFTNRDRNIILILLTAFCWYLGYQAIATWFTTFGVKVLYISEADASSYLILIIIPFILATVPSGIIGEKISRKTVIIIGFIMLVCCFIIISLYSTLFVYPVHPILIPIFRLNPPTVLKMLILICFPIMGISAGLIEVNVIPMVWKIGKGEKLGAFTGIFYFFNQAAAIIGPPFVGLFFDLYLTPLPLFPLALLFFIIGLLLMLFVKGNNTINK